MNGFVTRRPITPAMVLKGARKLWDDERDDDGKLPWNEAPTHAQWPYVRRSQLVLETAIPQDAEALREMAAECERTAAIL